MKQLVLNIEENRYTHFLKFLKTLNYIEVVQSGEAIQANTDTPSQKDRKKPHFMADLAGSLAGADGNELAEIISREFQQIEGEW